MSQKIAYSANVKRFDWKCINNIMALLKFIKVKHQNINSSENESEPCCLSKIHI